MQNDLRSSFLELSRDQKIKSFVYNFKNLDRVLDRNRFSEKKN